MEEEFDIKFGIVALDAKGNIHHFCGNEQKPNEKEFKVLEQELRTDEELGLTGKMDQLVLIEAWPELIKYMQESYDNLRKKK